MIYTGNYKNCSKSSMFVSISGDSGKEADFKGSCYKDLAPKLSFWNEWHDNIGKISEFENMKFYIENYYHQVLKYLDISNLIQTFGSSFIIGCYEGENEFCHRYIVASYLELMLGFEIPEVKIEDGKLIKIKSNKIKNLIDKILCDVIINDINKEEDIKLVKRL